LSSLTVIIDGRDFSPPESEYSRFGDPVALWVEEPGGGGRPKRGKISTGPEAGLRLAGCGAQR
jgi:hypothetical protein